MLLRISTLATGRTGIREETLSTYVAMLNAGITPGRPRVRLARLLGRPGARCRTARSPSWVRASSATPPARGCRPPRPSPPPGSPRSSCAEKEGLALINGTDGMLGMLVLAITDLRHAPQGRRRHGGDERRGAARHRRRLRRRPARPATAAGPGAARPRTCASSCRTAGSARATATREACTRVQDAYSLRCSPQVAGGVRDTVEHAASVAGFELASAVDNPVVTADGRVESNGNFHGAPVAYVLDFLAIVAADLASISERRTDRFLDVARNHGLHAFLADDPGVDSGHMIAQYTQAAIVSEMKRLAAPGVGRLDPQQRHAGGPRLDGLVRRPQAAPLGRRPHPGPGRRAAHRRPRARPARPARAGSRDRSRRRRPARRRAPRHRAPTGSSPPRSRPRSSSSPAARPWPRPSRSPARSPDPTAYPTRPDDPRPITNCTEGERHGRRPSRPLTARHPADPRHPLGRRGAAADAHEQPRPRERRASRRPRRLRRHGSGGPRLEVVRRDGPHPVDAQAGRDHARAERSSRRRHADPRVGAARAHRQLQPRRRLGDLAGVPSPRAPRADDVRPDDCGLVDLHRHPGHRAGDLRDVRAPSRRSGSAGPWPGR